jgi:hypothetical protein
MPQMYGISHTFCCIFEGTILKANNSINSTTLSGNAMKILYFILLSLLPVFAEATEIHRSLTVSSVEPAHYTDVGLSGITNDALHCRSSAHPIKVVIYYCVLPYFR